MIEKGRIAGSITKENFVNAHFIKKFEPFDSQMENYQALSDFQTKLSTEDQNVLRSSGFLDPIFFKNSIRRKRKQGYVSSLISQTNETYFKLSIYGYSYDFYDKIITALKSKRRKK